MRELFRSWRSDLVIEITERPVSCLGGTPETCAARAEYRVTRAEMDVMRELIIEVARTTHGDYMDRVRRALGLRTRVAP